MITLPRLGAFLGLSAVIATSILLSAASSSQAVVAAASPSGAPVTVIIPQLSPSPTPTKSNHGRGGHGNGDGNNGNGNGGSKNPDGSPIPPGNPSKDKPGLTLDHDAIEAREFMVASGSGYSAGEMVQMVLYPGATVVGSFAADATGHVSAGFRIPEAARSGKHVLEGTGWLSGFVANKDFTVTSSADADTFPAFWWLVIVLTVLLVGLASGAIYFRRTIAGWFGVAPVPQGSAS